MVLDAARYLFETPLARWTLAMRSVVGGRRANLERGRVSLLWVLLIPGGGSDGSFYSSLAVVWRRLGASESICGPLSHGLLSRDVST